MPRPVGRCRTARSEVIDQLDIGDALVGFPERGASPEVLQDQIKILVQRSFGTIDGVLIPKTSSSRVQNRSGKVESESVSDAVLRAGRRATNVKRDRPPCQPGQF